MVDPGRPVDRLDVRRHNLALILRLLAEHGPRSRAGLSTISGLTKATVSSLVADLIGRGLVAECGPESDQRLGRPATLVEIDGAHVVTLGIEVNVGEIHVLGIDLAGRVTYDGRKEIDLDSTEVEAVVPVLVAETRRALAKMADEQRTVGGVTIAIPGVVDPERGVVTFAPNLAWRGVPLRQLLDEQLGTQVEVAIFNEANLGALAEYRLGNHGNAASLVYVLAGDGVGAGLMVNGSMLHGASGGAGEVGHSTIQPRGQRCTCGSRGCWETLIALRGLLHETMPDHAAAMLADRRSSAASKVAVVTALAHGRDPVVLAGLRRYGRWLGLGLANIIDTINPNVIVLGGIIPDVAPWSLPEAIETVVHNALPESARACRIELTRLGSSTSARGAAIHAADRIFDDPTLVRPRP